MLGAFCERTENFGVHYLLELPGTILSYLKVVRTI